MQCETYLPWGALSVVTITLAGMSGTPLDRIEEFRPLVDSLKHTLWQLI